jgi:hypothetical protein
MWTKSIGFLTCVFILVFYKGLYPKIPGITPIHRLETISAPGPISGPEPISASEVIPALEPIRTLQPTQDSERIVVGTSVTTKKTQYALSCAFQQRSLPEHNEYI